MRVAVSGTIRSAQAPSDKQSGRVGIPFVTDSASQHRGQPESNRERPEHQRSGGFFVARDSPRSLPVLHSDHLARRTNRGRETMRDDPWTAANRDKEQPKVTIPLRRKPTAETPAASTKPTISGPFWTGKKSAPDVPKPQGAVDARQRTDDIRRAFQHSGQRYREEHPVLHRGAWLSAPA